MNYKGKKIAITGHSGFIGSALCEALEEEGASVHRLLGDVRYSGTFNEVNHSFDYLFHFGAPSSQVLFKRDPHYCAEVTLLGFQNAMSVCAKNGVKLVYPSTGLLSQGKTNEYADCKRICEMMASAFKVDSIGIRIFATYGPGEGHKRDYASVPYLFARDMLAGKAPVVFGDGSQKRDFIYIDDCIQGIMTIAEEATEPIVDLGSGYSTAFAEVLRHIESKVKAEIPDYTPETWVSVEAPNNYVTETSARPNKYYEARKHIDDGIAKLVTALIKDSLGDM